METVFFDIAIVVVFAAGLSWLALLLRQPIVVAYLVCGVLVGPSGLRLVNEVEFIDGVSRIGVTLLLFLAGIVLHPHRLGELFKQTIAVALCACFSTFLLAGLFAWAWGFSVGAAALVKNALMLSSTILVVKLLPTTTLHQQHMGASAIAILIAEDLIAVGLLIYMGSTAMQTAGQLAMLPIKGVLLIAFALVFEQFVLRKIMRSCDRFHETLYLLALAWCFGMAVLFERAGFSYEIGAFVAGVALARSPISLFLSEGLKPFRDFFLVLFFFVLGAQVDLVVARKVLVPALVLGGLFLVVKPLILYGLFRAGRESRKFSMEIGMRLNQTSEFSLIIAATAMGYSLMSSEASHLVELVTIFTMIASCYIVIFKYPTPLGTMKSLKQD